MEGKEGRRLQKGEKRRGKVEIDYGYRQIIYNNGSTKIGF